MNEWLGAAIAVVAALVVGSIARRVVVGRLSKESTPEALRNSAGAIGGLVFSAAVILGLLVALGIVDPDSLAQLPEDLVGFVPKAISAAILVIGGNVAATFAVTAIDRSMAGSPARSRRRVAQGVKAGILGAALLLAAGQLGVNTTILNLAAAALFFSAGATIALLTGLGGRAVSSELAAGRAVRRMIGEGDHLVVGDHAGVVCSVHPAAIELERPDGTTTLVPHSMILREPVQVRRQPG